MDSDSCESNFSFAFNDARFSDKLLRIEIMNDPIKRRRCENGDEAANNNDSIWTMDCSAATVVRVKTLHISSLILAAKSPFFYKLFSNGMSESEQRQITLRINASEEAGLMELLKFMYSNTLNISVTPALLDVLMAADKFDVPSCMKYLLNPPMTLDSALLYLELPYTVVAEKEMDSDSCESNFSFAFNDARFSDKLLRIEIMNDPIKRRRCENGDEAANNNDSIWTMDCSAATVVRVKTLHISSLILAAKSPFFYKLFSNGMSESEQRQITLRINASEEAGLMELLKFMYSNTLNISVTPALLDVLMAADKFDVPSCMKYLLNPPMTLDSALLYLELPYTVVAAQPLIDAAKHYLVDRYKDMYNKQVKEERLALPLSGIEAILASDDLVVESEEDVYTFTLNWARQKYKSLKERQEVLGTRLARLIRFPYMTCEKLKIVLTCNDFEHEGASKLVHEALSFKAEAPDRQQTLAAEESISLSRRFVERAYKTTMDMCLTRAEFVAMFPSGHVHSKPSRLAGQMFFLSAQCDMDEHDFFHCCSLSLGMKTSYSRSIAVDFQFSVRLRSTFDYYIMCKSNHTFTPGTRSNPFKVPWTSFIAEDSFFFINDVLHLRAKLWIAH